MADLALASIAYNAPLAIAHQVRLIDKYVRDNPFLMVYDNSSDPAAASEIQQACRDVGYGRRQDGASQLHHEGLNAAAAFLLATGCEYIGFLDHDVYPVRPTSLIPLIEEAGFLGIGQRHAPTGRLYPWPGFVFFSREWLAGRPLDFTGIRAANPADNGDTGSGLWPLFQDEDWSRLYRLDHGYRALREPDSVGLQSWGYELLGSDWIHITNASGWMTVPEREERDRLVYDLLASL